MVPGLHALQLRVQPLEIVFPWHAWHEYSLPLGSTYCPGLQLAWRESQAPCPHAFTPKQIPSNTNRMALCVIPRAFAHRFTRLRLLSKPGNHSNGEYLSIVSLRKPQSLSTQESWNLNPASILRATEKYFQRPKRS